MKFPSSALLEKVCAHPKNMRPRFERPFIDASKPDTPFAVATDGRLMAVVPIEANVAESGYLSIAALKQARKLSRNASITFGANRAHILENGMQLPREDVEGTEPPSWRACVPASDRPVAVRLSFSPVSLLALAEAIGSGEGITLEIHDGESSVVVRPLRAKHRETIIAGAFGVFMPTRSSP